MTSMHNNVSERVPPRWTTDGLVLGARYAIPFLPATALFGLSFGAVAVQKGLVLTEAALMSAIVFGGVVQLIAMEAWKDPMTFGVIAPIVLATLVANMRLFLMSASFRPWLGSIPPSRVYPVLLLTTDANWMIGMRYRARGGSDLSILAGSGLTIWWVWMVCSLAGFLAGGMVTDPRRFAVDLLVPISFAATALPLWRGARRAIPWAVAGIVALAVQQLVPGFWFMVVGALAGTIAGGFVRDGD